MVGSGAPSGQDGTGVTVVSSDHPGPGDSSRILARPGSPDGYPPDAPDGPPTAPARAVSRQTLRDSAPCPTTGRADRPLVRITFHAPHMGAGDVWVPAMPLLPLVCNTVCSGNAVPQRGRREMGSPTLRSETRTSADRPAPVSQGRQEKSRPGARVEGDPFRPHTWASS